MEKSEKKELIKFLKIIIPFILCVSYIIWFCINDATQLKKEPQYTKGVIIKKYTGPHGQSQVKFEFFVNKIKYTGDGGYSYSYDYFEIGDTCFVLYERNNPKNHKLIETKIEGRSIIKIKRSRKIETIAPLEIP